MCFNFHRKGCKSFSKKLPNKRHTTKLLDARIFRLTTWNKRSLNLINHHQEELIWILEHLNIEGKEKDDECAII